MNYQKIIIKKDNIVQVQCPRCWNKKSFPVSKLGVQRHYAKLKCTCDSIFLVQLECRQMTRKQTNLPGYFLNQTRNQIKQDGDTHLPYGGGFLRPLNCIIKNISKGGLGLTTTGSCTHQIDTGHQLFLNFQLDNSTQTEIRKKVVVRSVIENYIGCQFVKKDHYDTALGFYLLS